MDESIPRRRLHATAAAASVGVAAAAAFDWTSHACLGDLFDFD